jgi:uncharacterized protein YbjT (DUF2867 family)
MKILVTGVTGTTGRHIVKQLLQKGKQIRALSRNPEKAHLPKEVELVKGDLNTPESMQNVFQDIEAVFLITSSMDSSTPLQTDPKIIEMAEKAGVKHVTVLVGYEGPVEETLKNSTMKWTLLKPVEVMANILLDWKESIKSEGIVRDCFGDVLSARVHEEDIAAAAVASLIEENHHQKTYELTGPEALSRIEAVATISKGIGRNIVFEEWTEEEARQNWRNQGFEDDDIEFFVLMGKNPPEIGYTVVPTVEQVTGRPAKTLAEWVSENKSQFSE